MLYFIVASYLATSMLAEGAVVEESTGSSSGLSLAIRLARRLDRRLARVGRSLRPAGRKLVRQAGLAASSRADIGQEVFLAVHRGICAVRRDRPAGHVPRLAVDDPRNAVLQSRRRREPAGRGGSTAEAQFADLPDCVEQRLGRRTAIDGERNGIAAAAGPASKFGRAVEPQTWNAFWNTAVLGRTARRGRRRTRPHAGRRSAGQEPHAATIKTSIG